MNARRALRALAGAGLAAALVGLGGVAGAWRALPPADLSALDDRSVTVSDRNGRLLRAFTTEEGRWRLPLSLSDVDPRFIALLKTYEDRRFDSHGGVDLRAALRAAWQMIRSRRVISGGSTLSMQAARLIEPRGERSAGSSCGRRCAPSTSNGASASARSSRSTWRWRPMAGTLKGCAPPPGPISAGATPAFSRRARAAGGAAPEPETRPPDRHADNLRRVRDPSSRGREQRASPLPMRRRRHGPSLCRGRVSSSHPGRPRRRARAGRSAGPQPAQAEHRRALAGRAGAACPRAHRAAGGTAVGRDSGRRTCQRQECAPMWAGSASATGSGRRARPCAGRPLPGIGAEALHLRARLRAGGGPPRDAAGGQTEPLWRLCPREFRPRLPGQCQRQGGPAAIAQPASHRIVGRDRPAGAAQPAFRRRRASGAAKGCSPGLALGLGGVGIRPVDLARLYAGLARGGETPALRWREDEARQATPKRMSAASPTRSRPGMLATSCVARPRLPTP